MKGLKKLMEHCKDLVIRTEEDYSTREEWESLVMKKFIKLTKPMFKNEKEAIFVFDCYEDIPQFLGDGIKFRDFLSNMKILSR